MSEGEHSIARARIYKYIAELIGNQTTTNTHKSILMKDKSTTKFDGIVQTNKKKTYTQPPHRTLRAARTRKRRKKNRLEERTSRN